MFNDNVLTTEPIVFAVRREYCIMVQMKSACLMWITIEGKKYYDAVNGVLKSDVPVHSVRVPMKELDVAKKYTVCYRKIIERKAYATESEETVEIEFAFKPVSGGDVSCYHIADAHNLVEEPVKAVEKYIEEKGPIDFLILNGDIPEDSSDIKNIDTIYQIASRITHGSIPVVFSRGNHDTRGVAAEKLHEYTPCDNGNSYYTFRLGNIWGMILDCGEDKVDENWQYAHTVCCHDFRKKETEYVKETVKNRSCEYAEEGVEHIIAIVHIPFTRIHAERFNIEENIYREWARILKEEIKPEILICGHEHRVELVYPGEEKELYEHPCPVLVGARPVKKDGIYYMATGIEFSKDKIKIASTDCEGVVAEIGEIKIK